MENLYSVLLMDSNLMDLDMFKDLLIKTFNVREDLIDMMLDHLNKQGFIKVFSGTESDCLTISNKIDYLQVPIRLEKDGVQRYVLKERTKLFFEDIDESYSTVDITLENDTTIKDESYLKMLVNLCEVNIECANKLLSEIRKNGESVVYIDNIHFAKPIVKAFRYNNIPVRFSFFLLTEEEKGDVLP